MIYLSRFQIMPRGGSASSGRLLSLHRLFSFQRLLERLEFHL